MQKRIFKIVFIFFISAGVIVSLFSIALTYYERRIMTKTIENAVWLSDDGWPKNLSDCDKEDFTCFQSLVIFGLADETLCKSIDLPGVKNRCLAHAARNKQSPEICNDIEMYNDKNQTSQAVKNYCLVVSQNKSDDCVDLKYTTGIWGTYWMNNCRTDLAQLNKNPALCDVLDDYHRTECYVDVAYVLNDEKICNILPVETIIEGKSYPWRSRCKIEFQKLRNSNFPNWIQNTNH